MTAKLEASNESARRLLVESEPSLRAALEARGLSVERIEVTAVVREPGATPEASSNNNHGAPREHPGAENAGGSGGQSSGRGAEAHHGGSGSGDGGDSPILEPEGASDGSARAEVSYALDAGGVYRLRLDAVA